VFLETKRINQFLSKHRRGTNARAEMDSTRSKNSLAILDKPVCNIIIISTRPHYGAILSNSRKWSNARATHCRTFE